MVKKYKIFYKNDITNLYGGSKITLDNSQLKYNNNMILFKNNDSKFTGNVKDFPLSETNNKKFTGSVKDGYIDEGIIKYSNGDTYEGTFSNGMRSFGVYKVNESGINIQGIWDVEDKLLVLDEYKYFNGDTFDLNNFDLNNFDLNNFDLNNFESEIKEISENDYFVYGRNKNGKLKKVNGDIIKGEWINDKWNQNNEGQIIYSGGDVYKGKIKEIEKQTENGIFYEYIKQGQGTLTDNSNNKFVGNWIDDDLMNGTIIYKDGDEYKGELYLSETPDGNGKMKYKNGDIFDGKFNLSYRNGNGKMEYQNGDIFDGNWELDNRSGKGILKKKNGNIIIGEWINDELENGTIIYKNGNKYKGKLSFSELPNGDGKMEYQNRDIFDGEWNVGNRKGNGRYIKNNGDIITGEWIDDKWNQNKEGQILYSGGNVYEGKIKEIVKQINGSIFYEYIKHGKGVLTDNLKNTKTEGEWENDELSKEIKDGIALKPTSTSTSSSSSSAASTGASTSKKTSSSSALSSPPKEIEVLIKKLLLIFEDEKTKTLVNSFNMLKMNNFIDNNLSQFLIENKITVTFNNTISLIPVFTYMKSKDNDINTIIEMLFAFANYRNVSNNKNSYLFTRNI
jgi:hypothetical protein